MTSTTFADYPFVMPEDDKFRADTEEPMFHKNWVEYIQNSS
jgi:hypothetical protein